MSDLITVKISATFLRCSITEICRASVKLAGSYRDGRGGTVDAGFGDGLRREVAVGGTAADRRRGVWHPIFVGGWIVHRVWRAALRESTKKVARSDVISSKRESSLETVRWTRGLVERHLLIRCWRCGWRSGS